MKAFRFRTDLNCSACVAAVKPHLDTEPSISRWNVDLAAPEKTLTVEGDSASAEKAKTALAKAGFHALEEISEAPVHVGDAANAESAHRTAYYPLLLLTAFLIGLMLLLEVRAGDFVWRRVMQNFMGAFFVTFAFFKLLDLRGFAESYRMYDIVAKVIPAYAYAYPFIELTLGAAYVAGILPFTTNVITLVVMSISSVGVIQSLLGKRKIRCACLGTVFNLPMSTVTFVEDGLMMAMATAALLGVGH